MSVCVRRFYVTSFTVTSLPLSTISTPEVVSETKLTKGPSSNHLLALSHYLQYVNNTVRRSLRFTWSLKEPTAYSKWSFASKLQNPFFFYFHICTFFFQNAWTHECYVMPTLNSQNSLSSVRGGACLIHVVTSLPVRSNDPSHQSHQ